MSSCAILKLVVLKSIFYFFIDIEKKEIITGVPRPSLSWTKSGRAVNASMEATSLEVQSISFYLHQDLSGKYLHWLDGATSKRYAKKYKENIKGREFVFTSINIFLRLPGYLILGILHLMSYIYYFSFISISISARLFDPHFISRPYKG